MKYRRKRVKGHKDGENMALKGARKHELLASMCYGQSERRQALGVGAYEEPSSSIKNAVKRSVKAVAAESQVHR